MCGFCFGGKKAVRTKKPNDNWLLEEFERSPLSKFIACNSKQQRFNYSARNQDLESKNNLRLALH